MSLPVSQELLQILQGDFLPALLLGSTVLADEGIGVAGYGEGLDDLVVVPASCCKVLGGPGFGVLHTLGQDLINGGGDAVHLRGDGVAVVEDRLAGCAAVGQPAEDQPWEHEDEQHWKEKNDGHHRQQLFPMLARR